MTAGLAVIGLMSLTACGSNDQSRGEIKPGINRTCDGTTAVYTTASGITAVAHSPECGG